MPVTLEPIVWIVRDGPENFTWGDPFLAGVVAIKVNETTVRLAGLSGALTQQNYRDCMAAFDALGLTIHERTRHKKTPPSTGAPGGV